mmetsp:Transcript_27553/g.40505  ORF Transcript_27553/g.40505 Transcript_27553/m.40505 type:complete len:87 (-) Transcript_27553:564-824(-)
MSEALVSLLVVVFLVATSLGKSAFDPPLLVDDCDEGRAQLRVELTFAHWIDISSSSRAAGAAAGAYCGNSDDVIFVGGDNMLDSHR